MIFPYTIFTCEWATCWSFLFFTHTAGPCFVFFPWVPPRGKFGGAIELGSRHSNGPPVHWTTPGKSGCNWPCCDNIWPPLWCSTNCPCSPGGTDNWAPAGRKRADVSVVCPDPLDPWWCMYDEPGKSVADVKFIWPLLSTEACPNAKWNRRRVCENM